MEQSLFINEVTKYFPGVAARVVERINDTKNPLQYLHKSMLRKEYSTNLKWESATVSGSIVAADVIAMDSSLPLKKRDSLSRANGDIPKIGMEMAIRERELTELDILAKQPNQATQLLAKLFQDTAKVINGQYETLEYMFLLGLSTGVTVITDTNNVGTGIRIDYGYLDANKFGVAVLWSDTANATPFTDLLAVQEKASADGNVITTFMLDRATFNNLAKSAEAKEMYAAHAAYFGASIPVPTFSQINAAAQDRFGFQFQIVERSVRFEKNGVQTALKPWAVGAVVGLTSNQVGTLTYGTLAEVNHPVTGVTYTTVDDFILVSKYRLNRPSLAEFTSSQSLVLPVINGVDSIYLLDALTVQA
jgi:Phage major capsid protein E